VPRDQAPPKNIDWGKVSAPERFEEAFEAWMHDNGA
jgi:hypothetical protein